MQFVLNKWACYRWIVKVVCKRKKLVLFDHILWAANERSSKKVGWWSTKLMRTGPVRWPQYLPIEILNGNSCLMLQKTPGTYPFFLILLQAEEISSIWKTRIRSVIGPRRSIRQLDRTTARLSTDCLVGHEAIFQGFMKWLSLPSPLKLSTRAHYRIYWGDGRFGKIVP